MALSYSRRALEAISSSISSKPLSSSFWRSLCELGITRFKPTRRGCRAGVRKQRPLFTCEGPPLQSSTRSILSSNESCSNLSSSCERLHLYGNLHIPPSLSNSGILPSISNKPDSSKRNNNRRRLKDVPKNNRRKLICMTMNCRSAKNKIADIAGVIDQHKPDIIFGTESWLNSKIESNEIFPNGYKIFRKDRPDDCHGGGVFQAVKNDIITTHRSDLDTDCEIIWTQCQLADKKTKSLLFGSYYRPNSSNVISLDELDASLLKLGNSVHKNNIIVSGDFNAPDISWDTEYSSKSPASDRLLEIVDDHDLSQHVKEPTRRDSNTQNILDLILSNNSNIIENVSVVPGISDHDIVLFTVNTFCRRKKNVKRKIFIRKKADSTRIKEELTKLSLQMDTRGFNSIDEKWSCFEGNIHRIMDSCIPSKWTSSRYNLPWFNHSLKRLARRKQRLYNKAKISGKQNDWKAFRVARKIMHKRLKEARNAYISDYLGEAIEENPKRFWSYIKQLKKEEPGIADFEINGSIISDNKSKADILNNQFSSVFTQEDLSNIPDIGYDRIPAIDSLSITTNGVAKQLSLLKTNKASGPDAIPPWFLKEYAAEIAPILTNIFQDSIESGTVPSRWKSANVCGVFKKGKKSDPSNYRPISLTCIASKILEHIVHSHVMKHFEHYNILQQNKSIHAAVLDFSKAFDKVPHQRLLMKLERYGIHGNLLSWMESFLTKRVQTVICEGATSPSSPVTSGVPQGSVLGPLLFLTYINDLPNGLTSIVKLFADDTLLYGVVVDDSDCDNLQDDLNKLEIWQHEWQMQFNPSKCNIICISNKQRPPQRTYFFCGSKLEQVDSASYLGITVNSKLKWSEHISSISSKASRSLGLIKRNLWNCPRKVRETAYTSIVRPKLEYASASWDPHFKKDISVLERVQRKAARFCLQNFNKTASVTHMLSDLNWDTLGTRRKKNRLTLMYKLSHNLVDINTEEHLIPNSEKRTRNSHAFKYRMPKVSKDVFKFSFFPRSITEWNLLPADLVNCKSLSDFKSNLGKHLK